MSCVSFTTPGQREAMRRAAPAMLLPDTPVSSFRSPPASEGKLRRLRALGDSESAGIRASAASHPAAPDDVLRRLAADPEPSVRAAVAGNTAAPADLLEALARDPAERVRGWVAANRSTSAAARSALLDDASDTVRALARWGAEAPAPV